ncbi:4Fe-4S binding protein [Christensenellaceae bacterium OttesenSCG-928-K19]|nr:4Fe-4S binding protein [Christensenellaceae bacterium OttesenSCG-928-K19]
MKARRITQLLSALIYNANIPGFVSGKIYTEQPKGICVPGLNCYSCPGAVGACPLGTLQNKLTSLPDKAMFYIIGLLLLFGVLFGRFICGFLCPFGLIQELLHKIPTPKLKKSPLTRKLSYLKYVILALFIFILPGILGSPAFCKFICPAGTLQAGIPLVAMNESLQALAGGLFQWKIWVLIGLLILAVFAYRGFCRFVCPLGAIYSFFNKISIFGIKLEKNACTHCGKCVKTCPVDIKTPGDRECINCGKCISTCSHGSISWKHMRGKEQNEMEYEK